jgi:predicted aspartyl protease
MARGNCDCGLPVGRRSESRFADLPVSRPSRRIFSVGLTQDRWWLFAVLQCTLCALAFGGDLTTVAPPPKGGSADIPFDLYQGYLIMAEGRIGGLAHQNLLIDTGTSPSMIDKSVAARLGLQGVSSGISLFNKNLPAEGVVLPSLEFGPLRRKNLQVMVADFSKIAHGLGTHIDAVIGLDVMGATNFTIDYQKHRISFRASEQRHSAAFTAGAQFITVSLKAGNRQLHLLLDTGTPHLVLFKDALQNLDYDPTSQTGSGQNISGNVSYGTVILPQARFGTEDVGPQRASVVASRHTPENTVDGLIGVSVLRPKRISFDFDRQLLEWSN